jgi:hypothetical protein
MAYRISIGPRAWGCSHRGAPAVHFEPGTYEVPTEIPDHLAARCLREGRGKMVVEPDPLPKKRAPRNKALHGAPENK